MYDINRCPMPNFSQEMTHLSEFLSVRDEVCLNHV